MQPLGRRDIGDHEDFRMCTRFRDQDECLRRVRNLTRSGGSPLDEVMCDRSGCLSVAVLCLSVAVPAGLLWLWLSTATELGLRVSHAMTRTRWKMFLRKMLRRLPALTFLGPSSVQTRKFLVWGSDKGSAMMERLITEKERLIIEKDRLLIEKDVRIAEKDGRIKDMVTEKNDAVTLWRDKFTAEEKARIRAESRYSAVLADRSVLEVSAMGYRHIMNLGKMSATSTIGKIVDDCILDPSPTNSTVRSLNADAKKALTELQSLDSSFKQVSNADVAREMAAAYHNLSQRIHFPDKSSLSEGIYVGSGTLVSRAMIAVFTCIAQDIGLYDETVRLLNDRDEHSCTISKGAFLPR